MLTVSWLRPEPLPLASPAAGDSPRVEGARASRSFPGPVERRWSPGPLRVAWSPVDTWGCLGWVRGCVVWLPPGRCSPLHRTFIPLLVFGAEQCDSAAAAGWLPLHHPLPPPRTPPRLSRNTDRRRGKGCGDAQASSLREFWDSLVLGGREQ